MLQPAISNQRIDTLLVQLTDASERARKEAAQELASAYPGIDDPDCRIAVGKALLKALGDKKGAVRKTAILVLPYIHEAWAAEQLVDALANTALSYDQVSCHQIGEALERVGLPALAPMANRFLVELPKAGYFWIRDERVETAHEYFRSMGEAAVEYAISGISIHPKYPPTQHLLVSFGKAAEQPLLDLIKKEGIPSPIWLCGQELEFDPYLVFRGLGAAAVFGNKNDEVYKKDFQARVDKNNSTTYGAAPPHQDEDYKELFLGKKPVSSAMLTLVVLQMEDCGHYKEALISVLKQIGAPAVKVIVQGLPSGAGVLGVIGDPAAIEPLAAVLANPKPNEYERSGVIEALGKIGGASIPGILLPYLTDTSERVRGKTAEVLGSLKDAQATGALIAALNDQKAGVRKAVAQALGMIGDPIAVPALIERLTDTGGKTLGLGTGVGDVAAQALESIGTPEALEAVKARQTKKR
jgi:HEAT repeat protein